MVCPHVDRQANRPSSFLLALDQQRRVGNLNGNVLLGEAWDFGLEDDVVFVFKDVWSTCPNGARVVGSGSQIGVI